MGNLNRGSLLPPITPDQLARAILSLCREACDDHQLIVYSLILARDLAEQDEQLRRTAAQEQRLANPPGTQREK